jgi:hypothetical protein
MADTIEGVKADLALAAASLDHAIKALEKTDKNVGDLLTAKQTLDLAVAKLDLRVSTAEQGLASIRKLGFWALCLLLASLATPIFKFLLSGAINVVPTQ